MYVYVCAASIPCGTLVFLLYNEINVKKIFICPRDLAGNNKNSIANCIFYVTKKSNEPEYGS
jgi:hypothetical protein